MRPAFACGFVGVLGAAVAARANGFVVSGPGQLHGHVTDGNGDAARSAKVHVVAASAADHVVATDAHGDFDVDVGGALALVYVDGGIVSGSLASSTTTPDGEAVEIHAALPTTPPKPLRRAGLIPAYSQTAQDRNAWTRDWLVLDVDETGAVTRLKTVRPAGMDLDPIAEREAWKLKFEPGRDRAGHAIHVYVLWSFEWPAYAWLRAKHNGVTEMPVNADLVPCRGSGPSMTVYRDCGHPDFGPAFIKAPWTERPKE